MAVLEPGFSSKQDDGRRKKRERRTHTHTQERNKMINSQNLEGAF